MLIRSLVVLSLSAALLAGCGDDEPTASTPPAAETTTPKVELPTSPDVGDTAAGDDEAPADAAGTADEAKKKAGDAPSWVNQVNHRCKKHQEANNKALEDFQKQGMTGPEDAAKAMESLVPLGRQLVKDLRDVDVPGDISGDYDTFLTTLDGAFDLMPKLTESLTSGKEDPKLMQQLADIEKNTKPFADKYGLSECLTSGA